MYQVMVAVEKNRFGLIALQLQEDIMNGQNVLDKYTDQKREYKALLVCYAKTTALYSDLSHKYIDIKYKTKDEKILFNSIGEFYKTFLRRVSHHCFQGISPQYVGIYDRLLLAWESVSHSSKFVFEYDKINCCWSLLNELYDCIDELDDEAAIEHVELVQDILEDWEWTLQMCTDMHNSGEA